MMSFAKWIDDYCPVNPRQVMSFSAAAECLVCNAAVHHKSSHRCCLMQDCLCHRLRAELLHQAVPPELEKRRRLQRLLGARAGLRTDGGHDERRVARN